MTSTLFPLASLIITSYQGEQDEETQVFNGQGTAEFNTGNSYTGVWKNGAMNGQGIYSWSSGTVYSGEFKNNKMDGSGEYIWSATTTYTGMIKNGSRHGKGEFKSPYARYSGEWSNGMPNGVGVLTYADGGVYEGGMIHFLNADWVNGLKQGRGEMRYASGNTYTGDWVSNEKHGKGVMVWADHNESYEGEWFAGKPNGYGIHIWKLAAVKYHQFPMFNFYKGEFRDGKRDGNGVFYYASGARYEGEWKENSKHGQGTYISEYGQHYTGEFTQDRMVGHYNKFQNDSPFIFRIEGMLEKNDKTGISDHMKQINNVFLCYTDDLHEIYNYLCMRRQKTHAPSLFLTSSPGVITRLEIWHFIKHCLTVDNYVQIDRVHAVTFKNLPHHSSRFNVSLNLIRTLTTSKKLLYSTTFLIFSCRSLT